MGSTSKNYGFRAGYEVNDNFILPKCVGVFEISMERGIRFLANIDMEYDGNATKDFLKRYNRNRDRYSANVVEFTALEMLNYIGIYEHVNFFEIPYGYYNYINAGRWADEVTGFRVPASTLMRFMCDICGIQYDDDPRRATHNGTSPQSLIWRRFALAYSVVGPAYGHVEYASLQEQGPKGSFGMGLYFTFRKPVDGTKILLYVYDMSSLSLRNFVTSAAVGYQINYGARVIKREKGPTPEMFDTIYQSDFEEGGLESFHSSGLYLRLAASLDMKAFRYENRFIPSGTDIPPHPYGLLSCDITEYRGVNCGRYRNFGINNQNVALFVHAFVNEWHDVWGGNDGGWNYFPSFFTAFPPDDSGTMYCTSLTLDRANGGPIIQQMPGHMFFADVSQIDKYLHEKFGYNPKRRPSTDEGN
ncbi:hypothetical protein ACFGX4_00735 [Pasteurella multocida]|nr:hypothetical protein [Pasteurella multocida]